MNRACRGWWRWTSTRPCAWPRCSADGKIKSWANCVGYCREWARLLLGVIWWWSTRRSSRRRAMPSFANRRWCPCIRTRQRRPSTRQSAERRSESREWGVPPLEPLSIRTADFDSVPDFDQPMMVQVDSLDETFDLAPPRRSFARQRVCDARGAARGGGCAAPRRCNAPPPPSSRNHKVRPAAESTRSAGRSRPAGPECQRETENRHAAGLCRRRCPLGRCAVDVHAREPRARLSAATRSITASTMTAAVFFASRA